MSYDITPDAKSLIRALQNEAWSVSKALAELVDNSFGLGIGDATFVRIEYDRRSRLLTVLDDGKGMERAGLLFRIGGHIGNVGNISEYGFGGTKALISLGRRVVVNSLHDGKSARVSLDWSKVRSFPYTVADEWSEPTSRNTKEELLEQGHGTFIAMALPMKRRLHMGNIRRDLAEEFAPGLRRGLRIEIVVDGQTEVLSAPVLPKPDVMLDVTFEHEGIQLAAQGQASYLPSVSSTQSGISVGFYARQILKTKEPFRLNGEGADGTGIIGYIELADGWQKFLTATKQGIDDDEARAKLFAALEEQLRPLLEKAQKQRDVVLFRELEVELKSLLDPGRDPSLDDPLSEDGQLVADPDGTEMVHGNGKHPGEGTGVPASRHAGWVGNVQIVPLPRAAMDDEFAHAERRGDALIVQVDEEHPHVRKMRQAEPPEAKFALMREVVNNIAGLIARDADLQAHIFTRAQREDIEARHPERQVGRVVRMLSDRMVVPS
jgi:hypothetical protein